MRELAQAQRNERVSDELQVGHKERYYFLLDWYARKLEDLAFNEGRNQDELNRELDTMHAATMAQYADARADAERMAANLGMSVDELVGDVDPTGRRH
jgi:hypothetical protein